MIKLEHFASTIKILFKEVFLNYFLLILRERGREGVEKRRFVPLTYAFIR